MTDEADREVELFRYASWHSFLSWEASLPPNDAEATMQNANCGTPILGTNAVLTTTNADLSAQSTTIGYSYTPYPYTYPWSYSYTYTDPRITALEAKVELLEKMLAAVLSGGGNCKPRTRRK